MEQQHDWFGHALGLPVYFTGHDHTHGIGLWHYIWILNSGLRDSIMTHKYVICVVSLCCAWLIGLHPWVHCHGAAMQPSSRMKCAVSLWEAIMWRHDLDAVGKKSITTWLWARGDFWLHGYHGIHMYPAELLREGRDPIAQHKFTLLTVYWLEKLEIKAVFDLILWFDGILDKTLSPTKSISSCLLCPKEQHVL